MISTLASIARGACIIAGLALLSRIAGAGEIQYPLRVLSGQDGMSIAAEQVPVRDILEAVGRDAGIKIRSQLPLAQRVSLTINGKSIPEVLRRLLRHESYMYVYVPPPGISELWVFADEPDAVATAWTSPGLRDEVPLEVAVYNVSDDRATRLAAVTMLATGDNTAAIPTLIAAISDDDAAIRAEAIYGLGAMGGSGNIGQLQAALYDSDPDVREAAIEAIADFAGPGSVGALGALLQDSDPALRAEAVDALADIGGEEARRYLQRALHDEDALIRETAADYLAEDSSTRPASRF